MNNNYDSEDLDIEELEDISTEDDSTEDAEGDVMKLHVNGFSCSTITDNCSGLTSFLTSSSVYVLGGLSLWFLSNTFVSLSFSPPFFTCCKKSTPAHY